MAVDPPDWYAVLGISEKATPTEIKAAYRDRMLLVHPDKHGGSPAAEREAKRVNEAYTLLSDPARRRQYDDARRARFQKLVDGEVQRRVSELGRTAPPPVQRAPRAPAPRQTVKRPPATRKQSTEFQGLFHSLAKPHVAEANAKGESLKADLLSALSIGADVILGTYAGQARKKRKTPLTRPGRRASRAKRR